MHKTQVLDFGATDCALPMLDALEKKIPVDCFVILTDSETWAGPIHPTEALRQYRQATGINAWRCRVETHHVHHAGVLGVRDGESVGDHCDHHQLGVDAGSLPVLAQGLGWVDRARGCPG